MIRPSPTEATMPPKPASVRTIPAADLATSVAVETRFHLRLAERRASLAPSHTFPRVAALLERLHKVVFVFGERPQKPRSFPDLILRIVRRADRSVQAHGVRDDGGRSRASPVTITVRTPSVRSCVTIPRNLIERIAQGDEACQTHGLRRADSDGQDSDP